MTLPAPLALSLLLALPAGAPRPPPEASSVVRAEQLSLTCDVWGGDGEGLPTVFSLLLDVVVRNDSDRTVVLDDLHWSMPLGVDLLAGDTDGEPMAVPPGEVVSLHLDRYLRHAQVTALDEGVDSIDERGVHAVSGRVDFTVDDAPRYAVFTLEGRWRGCFEPGPPRSQGRPGRSVSGTPAGPAAGPAPAGSR